MEPFQEARVFVEVMLARKSGQLVGIVEIAHADGATLHAHTIDHVGICFILCSEFKIAAHITCRGCLDDLRFRNLGGLAALKAPNSDPLSQNFVEGLEDNREYHNPEEHNEKVD